MKINTKWTLFLLATFTVLYGIADTLLNPTYSLVENEDIKYSVVYYSNRLSDRMDEYFSFDTGTNYIVLDTMFSNDSGYIFDSWNTSIDGTGDKYNKGDIIVLNDDIKLYAQWKVDKDADVNTLENISLSIGNLNEKFDRDKLAYTASVDSDIVIIDVVKTSSKSTVVGAGKVYLDYGDNEINIAVISENGNVKIYRLIIHRKSVDEV